MKNPEIYLDCNATTPVLPIAAKAAQEAMESLYGNPSSTHITGLKARYILESTRDSARVVLGAGGGQVIFVSGATEGIQSAIFSALCEVKKNQNSNNETKVNYLLYGATEHKAVPNSLHHWNEVLGIGAEVKAIPVDGNGLLDLAFIDHHIADTVMICTMAVNNETGVAQDLSILESRIRAKNPKVAWMVDCVQALGKQALNLAKTTIDYAPFSGHKLYGPKGIGLLYVREGTPLTPVIAGGGQEGGARSGTENLPGVAAFGAILNALQADQSEATSKKTFHSAETLMGFRNQLVDALKQAFPAIVFNMPFEHSVPTTINFSIPGFPSKEILDLFDAAQIRVSSGSACSSAVTRSFVLDAMGLEPWRSESAIRMSFGPATSSELIEDACKRIILAAKALTQSCLILPSLADAPNSPAQNGLIQLKKGSACTWIIADAASKSCVIIDPLEALGERIENFVKCQQYRVQAILDTHSHADHESCRSMLQQVLQDALVYAKEDYDELGWPKNLSETLQLGSDDSVPFIQLGGNKVLTRLACPGHTADSQTYLFGERSGEDLLPDSVAFAFSGDTLLMGGIGRSNFESSSTSDLFQSLLLLDKVLSRDTVLCPAHDYNNQFATTLRAEIQLNRLLRQVLDEDMSEADFVPQKESVDKHLDDQSGSEILCGIVANDEDYDGIHIDPSRLHQYLASNEGTTVYDVREAHEYRLFDQWEKLKLERIPENVPLTKITDFIQKLIGSEESYEKRVLFICRSGARSGKLAETFRRLGFKHAAHVAGGVARSCC